MTSGDLPAHGRPDDVWLDEDHLAFPLSCCDPGVQETGSGPLGMTGSSW